MGLQDTIRCIEGQTNRRTAGRMHVTPWNPVPAIPKDPFLLSMMPCILALISPISYMANKTAARPQEIGRLTYEEDGPPPFGHVFEAADHKGLGTLPPLTFRRCLLEGLGFNLTEAECEALLEYLVSAKLIIYPLLLPLTELHRDLSWNISLTLVYDCRPLLPEPRTIY